MVLAEVCPLRVLLVLFMVFYLFIHLFFIVIKILINELPGSSILYTFPISLLLSCQAKTVILQ